MVHTTFLAFLAKLEKLCAHTTFCFLNFTNTIDFLVNTFHENVQNYIANIFSKKKRVNVLVRSVTIVMISLKEQKTKTKSKQRKLGFLSFFFCSLKLSPVEIIWHVSHISDNIFFL